MKKYEPANLQTVKEFIQRMLDGEIFLNPLCNCIYYFDNSYSNFYFDCQNGETGLLTISGIHLDTIKKLKLEMPKTIQDALAEKPRLCWVWIDSRDKAKLMVVNRYDNASDCPFVGSFVQYKHAELATLEEIKHYLED